jgi:hypothetical protein
MRTSIHLPLLLLSFAAGCAASAGSPQTTMDTNSNASPESLLREIRADAARRGGVDVAATAIVTSDAVTWRDGSLGCPAPGMMYTQALVPGWRVRIAAGGTTWEYHADRRGRWSWCAPEQIQPAVDDRSG